MRCICIHIDIIKQSQEKSNQRKCILFKSNYQSRSIIYDKNVVNNRSSMANIFSVDIHKHNYALASSIIHKDDGGKIEIKGKYFNLLILFL